MKTHSRRATCATLARCVLTAAVAIALSAGSASAAGPDKANITSLSTLPSSTQSGAGKNYVVTGAVNSGDTISLGFGVAVSGTGSTSTVYPDTLFFGVSTVVKPSGAADVVLALPNCTLADRRATCSQSATLIAPATPGAYQVKIEANDGRTGGQGPMTGDSFFINFTVAVPACTPAATTLVLSEPACILYRATSAPLSATLKSGITPIGGKTITFYVDASPVGTAVTDANGVATLASYDPSGLTVGDHDLSAEWQSDDACYQAPTVTGAKLGIQYLFVGFQPPINADGSTVLTGKAGPVKVVVADANGVPVTDANATVYFENGIAAIVGTDLENITTGLNFDYLNVMRYSSGQYVYNWDLSSVTNGTKTVRVFLDEGTCAPAHQVVVSVGKKR